MMPVVAEKEDIHIGRRVLLVGISGTHLQQVSDRDLLLPRIVYLSGELGEGIRHLLQ